MQVQPIEGLSPTLINAVLACPARVYLDARDAVTGGRTSATSLLGLAAHAVLEELVLSGSIWNEDLRGTVKAAWLGALSVLRGSGSLDLTRLPGFFVKQSRLEATARRLRSLMASA